MRLLGAPFLMILVGACSDAVPPVSERTAAIELTRIPTGQDASLAEDLGARSVQVIPIARTLSLRADGDLDVFLQLPDAESVLDLGGDPDPIVSVFIGVVDRPSQADLDFVTDAGARSVGALSSRNRIAADLPLSGVRGLADWERFSFVEIVSTADPLRPQY